MKVVMEVDRDHQELLVVAVVQVKVDGMVIETQTMVHHLRHLERVKVVVDIL